MKNFILYQTTTAVTPVTTATAPILLGDNEVIIIQAVFSGSDVAGTFKLQQCVDKTVTQGAGTWADISAATTSVTSSASTVLVAPYGPFVRFQWAYTSGTGNLTVYASIKERQVYN